MVKKPTGNPPSHSVSVGKKVKDHPLNTTQGTKRLKDFRGAWLLLYFYPKDATSGCTQEGLDFSALAGAFKRLNTTLLGVSPDSVSSHQKFKQAHGFAFELVADEDKSLCQHFGVWVKKSLYGRQYMGVERSSFLIDANGTLVMEWRKVKVAGHAQAVLTAVKAHQQ